MFPWQLSHQPDDQCRESNFPTLLILSEVLASLRFGSTLPAPAFQWHLSYTDTSCWGHGPVWVMQPCGTKPSLLHTHLSDRRASHFGKDLWAITTLGVCSWVCAAGCVQLAHTHIGPRISQAVTRGTGLIPGQGSTDLKRSLEEQSPYSCYGILLEHQGAAEWTERKELL